MEGEKIAMLLTLVVVGSCALLGQKSTYSAIVDDQLILPRDKCSWDANVVHRFSIDSVWVIRMIKLK